MSRSTTKRQHDWKRLHYTQTKAGPGRYCFKAAQPSGAKLWRKCPDKRRDLWREEVFRPGHPLEIA